MAAFTACVSGAASVDTVSDLLARAGFSDIRIALKEESRAFMAGWIPGSGLENYVVSATIEARKPAKRSCC
jgi:hypothetical protein